MGSLLDLMLVLGPVLILKTMTLGPFWCFSCWATAILLRSLEIAIQSILLIFGLFRGLYLLVELQEVHLIFIFVLDHALKRNIPPYWVDNLFCSMVDVIAAVLAVEVEWNTVRMTRVSYRGYIRSRRTVLIAPCSPGLLKPFCNFPLIKLVF